MPYPAYGLAAIKPSVVISSNEKIQKTILIPRSVKREDNSFSAKSLFPGFASMTGKGKDVVFSIAGEKSEFVFTSSPSVILMDGYDPSLHHTFGQPALGKIIIKDKNRRFTFNAFHTQDTEFHKDHLKPIEGIAVFERNQDGVFQFKLTKPLPPGNYLITWPSIHGMNPCWDFDIASN